MEDEEDKKELSLSEALNCLSRIGTKFMHDEFFTDDLRN
jgi:hypothetical protein